MCRLPWSQDAVSEAHGLTPAARLFGLLTELAGSCCARSRTRSCSCCTRPDAGSLPLLLMIMKLVCVLHALLPMAAPSLALNQRVAIALSPQAALRPGRAQHPQRSDSRSHTRTSPRIQRPVSPASSQSSESTRFRLRHAPTRTCSDSDIFRRTLRHSLQPIRVPAR